MENKREKEGGEGIENDDVETQHFCPLSITQCLCCLIFSSSDIILVLLQFEFDSEGKMIKLHGTAFVVELLEIGNRGDPCASKQLGLHLYWLE